MRRKILLTLVTALTLVGNAFGQAVTLDFSENAWNFPVGSSNKVTSGTYTDGTYTISIAGENGCYYYSSTNALLIGKSGATITLPAFDFAVGTIVTKGVDNGSGRTTFNVYVGENAVSTEVTSCKTDQTFTISDNYQAAGNVYTIQVTNANNFQISGIEIYKLGETIVTVAAPTISSSTNDDGTVTVTLAQTDGAAIYYTTDGSDPTTSSTPYSAAFTLTETATVKAIAVNSDGVASEVTSEEITITSEGGDESTTASTIDLTTTGELTFSDFSTTATSLDTQYGDYNNTEADATFTGNSTTYTGFTAYNAMYSSQYSALQLKASGGYVIFPTITSTNGFTITVTYTNSKNSGTRTFDIVYGDESVTSSTSETALSMEITDAEATGLKIYNNTSGVLYISQIVLTPRSASAINAPTISASEADADGNITVTITAVEGTTIYYTTDGTDPTTSSSKYTGAFTVSASCTVNAIAVSDDETSSIASETISFPVTGIRGIRDAILEGETSGTVTLTNAVVTYVRGSNNYIQDGTSPDDGAGIVLYNSSTGLEVGQTISGTMEWSGGQIYNGLSEITALDYTTDQVTTGTAPAAVSVDAETLAANIEKYESYYISVPFTVSEATTVANMGSYNVNDAGTVALYNSNSNTLNLAATDATFTGYTYNYGNGTTASLYVYSQSNISQTGSYTLSAEYGTFYSPVAFTAPSTDNLQFGIVPSVSNSVLTETYYTAGDEIPAKTGLLVKDSANATDNFTYLNFSTTEASTDNLLHGADALDTDGNTSVDGDYLYYYLTIEDGTIGFYWGAEDGAAFDFSENTNKAFLAVPTSVAVRGFSLGGTSTGIESVETATDNSNAAIYNLAGQRVSKATKGVYIQNGRKFVVK